MFRVIEQDILKYFYMFIGQGSKFAVVTFILTFLFGKWVGKKYRKRKLVCAEVFLKSVQMSLLVLYIYIVIGITLLSREKQTETFINLQLFSTFNKASVAPKYLYENLIMFMPFSILLYMLAIPFRNIGISMLVGFFCSLGIEIAQLLTGLGRFIVDDILINTIGMLLGYLICRFVLWIYNLLVDNWKKRKA